MRLTLLVAPVSLALALGACAPAPAPVASERAKREAAILKLVEPCQRRFPFVRVSVDEAGRLQAQGSASNPADLSGFQRCVLAEARRSLNVTDAPLAAGRIRAGVRLATAPVRLAGNGILVTAEVNGVPANLVLDTGATYTIVTPRLAQRAGIVPAADAPKVLSSVVGGRMVMMPFARLGSLGVGEAVVEGIEVGILDVLPHSPAIDGLLGGNFLNHFKMTIDREGRSLVLEPSRAETAGGPTSPAPPREWRTPRWAAGDEWRMRWRSATGSGSYVRRVEGEETVDAVAHYVVSTGTQRVYYMRANLGWHFEKAGDEIVVRRTPPDAYDWPLRVGKRWERSYRHENVRTGRSLDVHRTCTVAGTPTITVPAGTFEALHIVCLDREGRIVSETWYSDVAKYPVQQREATAQGSIVTELVAYSVRRAP